MATSAAAAKEKGNQAFKAGQWAEAIGQYTRAIVLSTPATLSSSSTSSPPTVDPTYYLNRAAAYLKLGKYDDAVRDCTSALEIRKGDVKALFRRAQARARMEDTRGALADLEEALKLEPGNAAVKQELDRLKALAKEAESRPKRREPIVLAETVKERTPLPAKATPAPRRRRVPIEIVDPPAPSLSSSSLTTQATPSDDLLTPISSTRLTGSSASSSRPPQSVPTVTTNPPPSTFVAAREAREAKMRRVVGGGVFKKDGSSRIVGSDGQDLLQAGVNGSSAHTVVPAPQPNEGVQLPLAPSSASEFSIAFKDLPDSLRWQYLQQIPPLTLPVLFGSALEPDILTSIIDALSTAPPTSRQAVLAYISFLPKVPRFSTNRMFLSSQTSARVKNLMDECGAGEDERKAWRV